MYVQKSVLQDSILQAAKLKLSFFFAAFYKVSLQGDVKQNWFYSSRDLLVFIHSNCNMSRVWVEYWSWEHKILPQDRRLTLRKIVHKRKFQSRISTFKSLKILFTRLRTIVINSWEVYGQSYPGCGSVTQCNCFWHSSWSRGWPWHVSRVATKHVGCHVYLEHKLDSPSSLTLKCWGSRNTDLYFVLILLLN